LDAPKSCSRESKRVQGEALQPHSSERAGGGKDSHRLCRASRQPSWREELTDELQATKENYYSMPTVLLHMYTHVDAYDIIFHIHMHVYICRDI